MFLRYHYFVLTLTFVAAASAQIVLDPSPARVLGHLSTTPAEQLVVSNVNPNLGVNGGMFAPQGVAVDTTGSTPNLYVADTVNNRVLAWKNATSTTLTNLKAPDLIIGQPNAYTTFPNSNGGLYSPTGLFVDPKGNLYIADSGNNRVLRYPTPFTHTGTQTPDIVLGQPDKFTSRQGNQGGAPSAKTICLARLLNGDPVCGNGGSGPFISAVAMDSAGNLFVADAGNNRVLRFPSASLTAGALDPAADIVIGQTSFSLVAGPSSQLDLATLGVPAGLAFDAEGHLFVTDSANRLVVYPANVSSPAAGNNIGAIRLAGIVSPTPATATSSTLNNPSGIVMINDGPAVADTGNNRVLIFDKYSNPDWGTTNATLAVPPPLGVAVLGQGTSLTNFTASSINAGNAQSSSSSLSSPVAVALAGTDLFVVDAENNRIMVFPNAGQTAVATVVLGQSDFPYNSVNCIQGREFYFGSPYSNSVDAGLAVDSSTSTPHLYVADPNNNRVLGFADARKVAPGVKADLVIGQPSSQTAVCNFSGVANPATSLLPRQPTQASLCYPTGLAVDPNSGDLFVADSSNGRVLRFPAPFDPANSTQQANLVVGQSAFTGVSNPQAGQSVTVFPYGLVYNSTWGLFVSDVSSNRVLLFPIANATNGEPATKVIGQTSFTATDSSVLSQPHHIAMDTINQVYVADTAHNQVLIFSVPAGTSTNIPVSSYNGTATGGALSNPQAVWVNTNTVAGYQNDVWVGDRNGLNRFPKPSPLGNSNVATLTTPAAEIQGGQSLACTGTGLCGYAAVAVAQDSYGNLYAADGSNRVAVHYQALAATNGASFACAMGCTMGGLTDPQFYLSPGAFATLFTFNSATFASGTTVNQSNPILTTLGGVQVLVNGTLSPITTVETGQLNFIVPFEAPASGTAQLVAVNASTSQVLGSGTLTMNAAAPGFFTQNQKGTGPIAALNQDNTLNGTAHPAAQGSVIQLFLTGQGAGLSGGAPPDGQGATGQVTTSAQPLVLIGGSSGVVKYSGLAPGYAGLWQINVQIPNNPTALPGFDTGVFPVFVDFEGFNSNTKANNANPSLATTIVIKSPS